MTTMRVVQVSRPNGPFEIVERPIPEPGAGSVRVKVEVCGICHSGGITVLRDSLSRQPPPAGSRDRYVSNDA
jgi:D-arabinose 1-dehydrogenase-like Zn-dependent alcohol dehydrogenase